MENRKVGAMNVARTTVSEVYDSGNQTAPRKEIRIPAPLAPFVRTTFPAPSSYRFCGACPAPRGRHRAFGTLRDRGSA